MISQPRHCTRRLEFDAAHRVMRHESKCRNLHGHRYVADINCVADSLDPLGRVVDFSVIKDRVGGFIDRYWDHACLLNGEDLALVELCRCSDWPFYTFQSNPTAEVIAERLCDVAGSLLSDSGILIQSVRIYETPNCWSDFYPLRNSRA